ncbi:hypothetical protein ACFS4T_24380 [Pseudomonas lini]
MRVAVIDRTKKDNPNPTLNDDLDWFEVKFDQDKVAWPYTGFSLGEKVMLKDPFMNEDFEPNLMWFIGVFNVYDREETRGEELVAFDPDNQVDRDVLIVRYSLKLRCLSYRHKFVLFEFFLAEKAKRL